MKSVEIEGKQTIFYFAGRAGDLATALLKHATASLAEQNAKTATVLKGPLRTIGLLTSAARDLGTHRHGRGRAAMHALMRPPFASPLLAKDCTACNGTGYVVVPNGPEDVEKELCQVCNGKGRVVANN